MENISKKYFKKSYDVHSGNDNEPEKRPYESKGLAAKVAYVGKRLAEYVNKVGYSAESGIFEPNNYQNFDISAFTSYILPIGYANDNKIKTTVSNPNTLEERLKLMAA